jgi:hypothetical protein
MRYQEKIYIQNNNSGLRNRDNVNVNMSSDMCIFNTPSFDLSGATKIDCTGSTSASTYFISSATTIPLNFNFTANTETFSATNATFKYEVYKYNNSLQVFLNAPVYKSGQIAYSSFSGTNQILQNIPIDSLDIDGDYLVKGYYDFAVCTDFLNRLGKTIDTLVYKTGTRYGIYDEFLDYNFTVIKQPDEPKFLNNGSNNLPSGKLQQQIVLPDKMGTVIDEDGELVANIGYNTFLINNYAGNFIVTLNGMVLAPIEDYTFTGNLVTLNSEILLDDIITVIYTTAGPNNLVSDNIFVLTNSVSGVTNAQGENKHYFNTTNNKYEIYTSVNPNDGDTIIVMLNGATLANGIDYYQSITNPKRIILEGDLMVGDVITIAYFPMSSVVNGIQTNNPFVSWIVDTAPQAINGQFTLELSPNTIFSGLVYSSITEYVIGQSTYGTSLVVSGAVGTNLYYRVKNEKNFINLCGNIISASTYSEVIPILIQSNSINSY